MGKRTGGLDDETSDHGINRMKIMVSTCLTGENVNSGCSINKISADCKMKLDI